MRRSTASLLLAGPSVATIFVRFLGRVFEISTGIFNSCYTIYWAAKIDPE
jgi:hypothetical protein